MYITIDDIIGENTIDLSDPIWNFGSSGGWGKASKDAPEWPHSTKIAVIRGIKRKRTI